jgi:hypothetical protein
VALNQYLATEEGRNAAQASLVASVANAWLALAADEELLTLTRDTLATRAESLRLTRLRFENGASSELDFRQAESLHESARVTLAQLQRLRALDLNALALLLGTPVPTDYQVGVGTDKLQLPDLPAGVPAEVLAKRPDVRQAELLLIAANANIGAARAAFFPRISLTAALGVASSELNNLFQGGTFGYTVAPSLLLPIFDAGRNSANLARPRPGATSRWRSTNVHPGGFPRRGRCPGRPRHLRRPACRPGPRDRGRGRALSAGAPALRERRGELPGPAGCAAFACSRRSRRWCRRGWRGCRTRSSPPVFIQECNQHEPKLDDENPGRRRAAGLCRPGRRGHRARRRETA